MSEKLKLCVDIGHSGAYYNAGAATGYYESAQMWKLGKYLIPELESYGIEVVPTRTKRDVDLDLEVRGRKAKGCAGLVSLHSNAADSKKTNYVVAMHQVDDNCGKMDEVSAQLADRLANCVADVMGAKAQTWSTKSGHDRDKNGYKDDYYGVLRGAHSVGVPAVIIEHGFHTNPAQAAFLMKNANLRKLAKAEAETIADFYGVTKTKGFDVRIKVKTLRVRSGAGTEHQIVTKVKRGEVYTITKTNEAGTWGRLKSGAGWICITPTYVERV